MTPNLEQSFKSKLRMIAIEKSRDPADLWHTLMLERLLARLGQSNTVHHFILKGATLLSKYIDIGRETRDLDFLVQNISSNIHSLQKTFEDITKIDLEDGFLFRDIKATELLHPHMSYPGVEISMSCYFGKTRSKVTLDLGFGDIVEPLEYSINLMHSSKGPLFEDKVRLNCYPREFIFAEKLETIFYRGASNSRMKDFHDLYSLIANSAIYPFKNLGHIIKVVFKHRNTSLALPLVYTDQEIQQLQSLWSRYLRNLKAERSGMLPQHIIEVIAILNQHLPVYL